MYKHVLVERNKPMDKHFARTNQIKLKIEKNNHSKIAAKFLNLDTKNTRNNDIW